MSITATEAQSIRDNVPARILRRAYDDIRTSARQGNSEVVINGVIPAAAKTQLETDGFTVTEGSGNFTVSWE